MKMIFNYDANKTHFHSKGFSLSLVLKVRFSGTRKWAFYLNLPRNRSQCLSTSRPLKKGDPGNKTESLGPVRGHHLAE